MTQSEDFTHIHVHSEYSLLDGENKIKNLVNRAKELGFKQLALTDHGNMAGSLSFYKACKEAGIKPILGNECYITEQEDLTEVKVKDNFHLVLLAKNEEGFKNLLTLTSKSHLYNFYMKPRISKTNLRLYSKGLIASSACLGSELNRKGFNPETNTYDIEKMKEVALWYKETFADGYYLEIQDNDDAAGQQKLYNQTLIQIGKELDIPISITSDAHYTKVESSELHSMLMAMQLGKTLEEYNTSGNMKYGPWFYLRSAQEMREAAIKYNCEEAYLNTCEIGNKCEEIKIELGKYEIPLFPVEEDPDWEEFKRLK